MLRSSPGGLLHSSPASEATAISLTGVGYASRAAFNAQLLGIDLRPSHPLQASASAGRLARPSSAAPAREPVQQDLRPPSQRPTSAGVRVASDVHAASVRMSSCDPAPPPPREAFAEPVAAPGLARVTLHAVPGAKKGRVQDRRDRAVPRVGGGRAAVAALADGGGGAAEHGVAGAHAPKAAVGSLAHRPRRRRLQPQHALARPRVRRRVHADEPRAAPRVRLSRVAPRGARAPPALQRQQQHRQKHLYSTRPPPSPPRSAPPKSRRGRLRASRRRRPRRRRRRPTARRRRARS